WAWLIALLFLPEALATWVFARPRWARTRYFRFLCSAGGALNIAAMMAANLVGFGDEGVDAMLAKFASRQGAVFLGAAFVVLNAHLQVMFELREHERRQEFAARSDAAAKSEVSQAESTASRPSPSRAKAS
ncbi:glycerol transporter, partial [Coemansia sp. RSA 2706]